MLSSNSLMEVQISGSVQSYRRELQQQQCTQEHLSYKNRLQEYTHRASLPLPAYHTVNEGEPHVPKFRSTVEVDGERYMSLNTFSNRKAAEKDAALLALEGISTKIKNKVSDKSTDEVFPPIHEDKVFCKSILHEFAVKTNKEKPTYDTLRLEGLIPLFVSSLVFDGSKYTGGHGVNKKEAEQLAARAAILSILGNSEAGIVLSKVVKSKARLITAVHESSHIDSCALHIPSSNDDGQQASHLIDNIGPSHLIENVGPEALEQPPANKKANVSKDLNEAGTGQQASDLIENVGPKALQQQSANKKVRVSNDVNEAGNGQQVSDLIENVGPEALQQQTANKVRVSNANEAGNSQQASDLTENVRPEALQQQSPNKKARVSNGMNQAGDGQLASDLMENIGPKALQQQSANKKVTFSSDVNEAGDVIENVVLKALQLKSRVILRYEFGKPILEFFPQPSSTDVEASHLIDNVQLEALQQQSANKKVTVFDDVNEAGDGQKASDLIENVRLEALQEQFANNKMRVFSCVNEASDGQQACNLVENVEPEKLQQQSANKKVRVFDDVNEAGDGQKASDLTENIGLETLQQQFANKKVRVSSGVNEASDGQQARNIIENIGPETLQQQQSLNKKLKVSSDAVDMIGNVVRKALQLQSPVLLRHEFGKPIFEIFPQPSLLSITTAPELQAQISSGGGRMTTTDIQNTGAACTMAQ